MTTSTGSLTRLHYSRRHITSECVYFRSCDKDGSNNSRSTIATNPILHVYFTALSSIEPELLPIEVLHWGNREFGAFCSCNLDLDPMTFIYKLDPYLVKQWRHWGGGGAPRVTPSSGCMTREWNFLMWLNLERTVDKRGQTAKKRSSIITLQTAMTKKSSVFSGKKIVVTPPVGVPGEPTLVTPLPWRCIGRPKTNSLHQDSRKLSYYIFVQTDIHTDRRHWNYYHAGDGKICLIMRLFWT